jgi:spoIIIJ-associated protein
MSQEERPDDVTSTENDDRETDHEASDDALSEPVRADGDDGARPRRNQRARRRRAPAEDVQPTDERTREALEFVTKVVKEMEMDCRVRLRRNNSNEDNGEINIEIDGRDAGRIIGKKGQVLAALQFLTHRIVNRPGLERRHILVDAEGYRSRRDDSLATMARRLGRQAVEQGKIITFEPMNPRDRRVVHLALAKFEGVVTKSDGEGDDRRVQIIPVRR